jgi:Uma2 family endonuclease
LDKVTVFRLDDGWYEPAEFQGDDLIRSTIFPAMQLSLDRILG